MADARKVGAMQQIDQAMGGAGWGKVLLAAGALFVLWKAAKGAKDLAWTAFGLGMAAYWTGFWPW